MIRLALRVRRADAEVVLAQLLELAPAGAEERDLEDGRVEYAIYGAPGELPALPGLRALAGDTLVEVSTSEVADDWRERWREFHRPILVERPPAPGARVAPPPLYVRPPWERASERASALDVVIDPGQAFGTGAHATTRLCLELLLEVAAETGGGALLDVGTGSGVLAIAAARLGFAPVLALDSDPASVAAARANARANGVSLEVRECDVRRERLPRRGGLVVLANLLAPLLRELARRIAAPPAHLIASGLLAEQASEVALAFRERFSLREQARRHRGEWTALWLSQGPSRSR